MRTMLPRCLFVAIIFSFVVYTTRAFTVSQQQQQQRQSTRLQAVPAGQQRENEIRRKILQLKRQGRLQKKSQEEDDDDDDDNATTLEKMRRKNTSAAQDYGGKLKAKLGKRKAKLLGLQGDNDDDDFDLDDDDDLEETSARVGQLGSLSQAQSKDKEDTTAAAETVTAPEKPPIIDPSLFKSDDDDDDDDEEELDELELIDLVAKKLSEQKKAPSTPPPQPTVASDSTSSSTSTTKSTTGVGGKWIKDDGTEVETYQPKSGSWGAFPRPKDISKAYGGGRRIGVGYSDEERVKSAESTREKLRRYREKVGIEVQSEKDHADEIDEALTLAGYAMQRGVYSTAVSALEKVTKYCSTNSKVGGKVFLELAMAYEAEGRTQAAITIYTALTKCRIEDIKFNAKRLLYGIEAMNFMRNEAKSEAFSRKKIRNTFIDTTGLENFAENFDDVYETAYIDLDSGFYRRLTQSVVRSNREARQILLKATARGDEKVEHIKIVQALRSLSRSFDTAIQNERKQASPQSVAVMDGKPIVQTEDDVSSVVAGMDEFVLASPDQTLELLDGEWRLQLVADKQGDGVKYDNNTIQQIDTDAMTFESFSSGGFMGKVSQSGDIELDSERRVLSRSNVKTSGGALFFMGSGGGSQTAAQQIVSVDSVLLVTRIAADKKRKDNSKGFFSVWRNVGGPEDVSAVTLPEEGGD